MYLSSRCSDVRAHAGQSGLGDLGLNVRFPPFADVPAERPLTTMEAARAMRLLLAVQERPMYRTMVRHRSLVGLSLPRDRLLGCIHQ
jgi:hypothetical protein